MAIQYIKENYVRRSKGHNAVEHSAKRSCSKLSCYRTGKTFDFSDRVGCVYSEILLPETAYNDHFDANNHPLNDRQELWNAIEEVEDAHNMRKTAQLALELQIALPNELKINQNIELINSFIEDNFVREFNVPVDITISENENNIFSFVMIPFRSLGGIEFSKVKVRGMSADVRTSNLGAFVNKKGRPALWKSCQEEYFRKNGINLVVDQDRIIATKHQGKVGFNKELNAKIKKMNSKMIADNPLSVIDTLQERQESFIEKDIDSFISKCSFPESTSYEIKKTILSSDRIFISKQDVFGNNVYYFKDLLKN